jgi:hypothetical protein
MIKTPVEEVVDELDEAMGEVDPMVEEDEIFLFWNNRQVRCKQHLVA